MSRSLRPFAVDKSNARHLDGAPAGGNEQVASAHHRSSTANDSSRPSLPLSARDPDEPHWSPLVRVSFRFALIYFTLYSFFPSGFGPSALWDRLWLTPVRWVAEHFLHLATPITLTFTGSGDTTFRYVQVLSYLVIALVGTLAWSAVAEWRGRRAYPVMHELLRIYVRYTVAFAMLQYGMSKVLVSQFPPLTSASMLRTYGESSPRELLWNFMSASAPYTVFAGLAEVIGGALLLFRRTTLLGALIVAAVMTNVVMLNFCYDVPAKLYSSHLLLITLFLLLPDARRLADVILLNRTASPRRIDWPWPRRPLRWPRLLVKMAIVVLATDLIDQVAAGTAWRKAPPCQSFDGTYKVEVFTRDGEAIPPLLNDGSRWQEMSMLRMGFVTIRWMDGREVWYAAKVSPAAGSLVLKGTGGFNAELAYREIGPDQVQIEGSFDGAAIAATLRRVDERSFPLINRGFHWINE